MEHEIQLFLRRGAKIGGPRDLATVIKLIEAGKLGAQDQCGSSVQGPWRFLGEDSRFQYLFQPITDEPVDEEEAAYTLAPLTEDQKKATASSWRSDSEFEKKLEATIESGKPTQSCLNCDHPFSAYLTVCPNCRFDVSQVPQELAIVQEESGPESKWAIPGWVLLGAILFVLPVFILVGSHFHPTAMAVQYIGGGMYVLGLLAMTIGFIGSGVVVSPIGWIVFVKQAIDDGIGTAFGQIVFVLIGGLLLVGLGAGAYYLGLFVHDYAAPVGGLSIGLDGLRLSK